MMTFHWLVISVLLLPLLFTEIDASQYRSVRQKRANDCPIPPNSACFFVACENGGTCNDDSTTIDCFKCACTAGFAGTVCEIPIAILPTGCNPGCQNGGLCSVNMCLCPTGYTGALCEMRDYCLPYNPCQNGGQCTSNGISYVCDCTGTGYDGATCTSFIPNDPCVSSPCENGGLCRWDGTTMNCLCSNSYSGAYCQIPPAPCATTPCLNGGTCELVATDTYGCVCLPEFTGTQCESSTLATHPCVTMPLSVCQNGGVCTINGPNYLCNCAAGWTGTNCETKAITSSCNPDPCGGRGTCFEISLPIGTTVYCDCMNSWTGKYCDVNMDVSCVGYCLSGGTCQMNGNVPYCECPPLYTGYKCESYMGGLTPPTTTLPVGTLCATNPCQNGGTCYDNNQVLECSCLPDYTGQVCEFVLPTTPTITSTDSAVSTECANQPCQNGGTCVPVGTSYSCFCGLTTIYNGKNCDSTTPMPTAECPLNCAPGRCIFSGYPLKPYACLWNGNMRPIDGTTG